MARITQQSSIHTTGTSYENEPIIKSDGAGEVMQWKPSDGGTDGIFIAEGGSAGDPLRLGVGVRTPATPLGVSPIQYNTGTAVQTSQTVTGSGTTWTAAMIGGQFVYADGTTSGVITARASNTEITVTTSQSVGSQAYGIHYTGLQVSSTGKVGVGIAVPTAPLHVYSNTTSEYAAIIDHDNVSGGHGLKITSDGNGTGTNVLEVESGSTSLFRILGNGLVGIPDALHIGGGTANADAGADELVIAPSSGNGGITINTPSANGLIYFADASSLYSGYLAYNHSDNEMTFATAATPAVKITDTGGIIEVGGVLKSNLLTNSGFDVWSNSTLEAIGSELMTGMTNTNLETFPGGGLAGAYANDAGGYGVAYQAVSLSLGKLYKLSFDGSSLSGVATDFGIASSDDGANRVTVPITAATGISLVFEASALTTHIILHTSSADASGFTLANISLKEVTPGCVVADTKAVDGWLKTTSLDIWRQHNDGGTLTKDGSFYALKSTTAGTGQYIWSPSIYSKAEWTQRFAGRTVTLGCWAKTSAANHCRLGLGDGSTSYSDYHTGGGAWEWLELTKSISATATQFWWAIYNNVTATDAYISQPMLVFGSAIGSGNYSRPSGEIVWCESQFSSKLVANGYSDVSSTSLNLEADSDGKIPKGAKAVHAWLQIRDSDPSGETATGMFITGLNGSPTLQTYVAGLPATSNGCLRASAGFVGCTNNGDVAYVIDASGSATLDITGLRYNAVQLR